MDAKAKIGLAIGGILLAGMVAYVLMPAHKTAPEETVSQPEAPVAPADLAGPATAPTTEPMAGDPFATPFGTTQPIDSSISVGGPGAVATTGEARDPWGVLDNAGAGGTGGTPRPVSNGFGQQQVAAPDLEAPPAAITRDEPLNTMPRTYRVQSGDSLYTISQKLFGSPKYVAQIQNANPRLNPKNLKVGQEIKLPDIDGASAAETNVASSGVREGAAAVAGGRTYKVQSGDSLRRISRKVYGSEAMWQKIYQLNRKQIGPDSSRLKVGMTLQLPEQ